MARSQRRSVALQCRLGRSRSRHGSVQPAPSPGRHQAVRGVAGQTSPSCARAARTAGRADSRSPKASRRSEEHTSELQSLMRISYAVFCLKKKKNKRYDNNIETTKIHNECQNNINKKQLKLQKK